MLRSTGLVALVLGLTLVGCSDDAPAETGGSGGSTTDVGAGGSGAGIAEGGSGGSGGTTSAGGSGEGGAGGRTGEGGDGGEGGEGGEGGKQPVCEPYPVALTLPDTQAAALADLQSFAPNATLNWAPLHGTLSTASGLGVTLDCAGNNNDVWDAAWALFEEHPVLFQLNREDWPTATPYPCSAVTSSSVTSMYREKLAGLDVQKDVFGLFIAPANGGVQLNGVSGFYLPALGPEDIQDCPNLPDSELEEIARAHVYTYSTYSFCSPTGSGTYTPQPNDVISFDSTTWRWEDPPTGVVATKLRYGTLILDESNWTEELMASDANCPDESGQERVVGFRISVDPVTGESFFAGPGVGCIVCLTD